MSNLGRGGKGMFPTQLGEGYLPDLDKMAKYAICLNRTQFMFKCENSCVKVTHDRVKQVDKPPWYVTSHPH